MFSLCGPPLSWMRFVRMLAMLAANAIIAGLPAHQRRAEPKDARPVHRLIGTLPFA